MHVGRGERRESWKVKREPSPVIASTIKHNNFGWVVKHPWNDSWEVILGVEMFKWD